MTEEYKATSRTLVFPKDLDLLDPVRDLAARVEALEEAENDRRFEAAKALIDKPAPVPAGSLVERVAGTLHAATNSDPNVPANEWIPEARAAIREVAAWLRLERQSPMTADVLEQEADRG
jgi:hypothetical protein